MHNAVRELIADLLQDDPRAGAWAQGEADRILAAIKAAGYAVVPVKATDAMKDAYRERWGVPAYGVGHEYRAMIAAAQKVEGGEA